MSTQILIKALMCKAFTWESFEAMNRAIALQIKPVVDRVFPFSETKEAYRHLQSGAHFKIVIQL